MCNRYTGSSMHISSYHQNTKKAAHLLASCDVTASNRKRSSRGILHKGDEGTAVMVQGYNEYGERYEWIEKSNSTGTFRHNSIKSQYLIQVREDFKHLTRRCGCGDFRARHRAFVPESGEEADDEESAWSQFSPRSPPTLPEGKPGDEDEERQSPGNVSKARIDQDLSPRRERRYSPLPVAKRGVKVKFSKSQVPQLTLRKKVEKRHSLPSAPMRKSVKRVQKATQAGQRVAARSSSYAHSRSVSLDSASSDLSIDCVDGVDGYRSEKWRSRRVRPHRADSAPVLEIQKMVVHEEGDEPSTTVTFRGHVSADLLNDILFGRAEHSCPCWPQYDVDRQHMGCLVRSGPNHVLLRSAMSEPERHTSREKLRPPCGSDVAVNYASRTQHDVEQSPPSPKHVPLRSAMSEPGTQTSRDKLRPFSLNNASTTQQADPHIESVPRPKPKPVPLHSAVSVPRRQTLCVKPLPVNNASTTGHRRQPEEEPSRRASLPVQRPRAPLVRFRSELVTERPHRANSPALRRPALISTRRERAAPARPETQVQPNRRRLVIT